MLVHITFCFFREVPARTMDKRSGSMHVFLGAGVPQRAKQVLVKPFGESESS